MNGPPADILATLNMLCGRVRTGAAYTWGADMATIVSTASRMRLNDVITTCMLSYCGEVIDIH